MVYKKNYNYYNQLNEGTQNIIQQMLPINILFFFRIIMYANNM